MKSWSKKAAAEISAEETTNILLKVFTFIIIVTIFFVIIYGISTGGPDATCTIFASANGITGARWILIPKFFCSPKGISIDAAKYCDCDVFAEYTPYAPGQWQRSDCESAKVDGKCNDFWQRRYVINRIIELSLRCWKMGSAGKRNTGAFGCFFVQPLFYGSKITRAELMDGLVISGVVENEKEGTIIGSEYYLACGITITDKVYRDGFLIYGSKGSEDIMSFSWVGLMHCGADPSDESKQKVLYFSNALASNVDNYMQSWFVCP